MNIRKNRVNRSGTKCYRVNAEHKTKKADHLDEEPSEKVKMNYNGGMVSADRGRVGTWTVREHYNLNNSETFESFEAAVEEFEKRTGETPPEPGWF